MEYKQTYERILPKKSVGRWRAVRIVAHLGYVSFALLWIAPIIRSLFQPTLIALAVLTTATLILCTRKYLNVEYEYAFIGETLTVSKIYGKRRRKTMAELDLKKVLLVAPATDAYFQEAERFSPEKSWDALSSPSAENVLLVVWSEDADTRQMLLIESDEQAITCFRRHAPQACSRELRSNIR